MVSSYYRSYMVQFNQFKGVQPGTYFRTEKWKSIQSPPEEDFPTNVCDRKIVFKKCIYIKCWWRILYVYIRVNLVTNFAYPYLQHFPGVFVCGFVISELMTTKFEYYTILYCLFSDKLSIYYIYTILVLNKVSKKKYFFFFSFCYFQFTFFFCNHVDTCVL